MKDVDQLLWASGKQSKITWQFGDRPSKGPMKQSGYCSL